MKRLIFFIIGLILFIWLLMTAVKFMMNTDFYKSIADTPSPFASQTKEKNEENESSTLEENQNEEIVATDSSEKTPPNQTHIVSSHTFTAGTRGAEGAAFLLETWVQEEENELFQIIGAMENAMSFSVEDALKKSDTPEKTLQEILENFEKTKNDGQRIVQNLTNEKNTLEVDILEGGQILEELEAQYFEALNAGDKEKSDAIFEKYVALKKDLVEKQARLGQVQALLQKASSLLAQLTARIDALKANDKALICGIFPTDLAAQAQMKTQDVSSSASTFIPEFTIGAPRMTGEGYVLGESIPVVMAENVTFSGDTGNAVLPKHIQDLRIPQLYETGWNTMGMRPVYASEVEYLNYLHEDSRLDY